MREFDHEEWVEGQRERQSQKSPRDRPQPKKRPPAKKKAADEDETNRIWVID